MNITSRSQLGELLTEYNLPRIVVELGCAECRYSREMLVNWDLDELYLVDIWETMPFIEGCASFDQSWHDANYAQALQLKQDAGGKVHVLKGFTHKVVNDFVDGYFSIVYVDADHTYNGCKTDISLWYPKLCKGGIMAFHDYGLANVYGVNRAVNEFASAMGLEIHELIEDGNLENKGAWIQKK